MFLDSSVDHQMLCKVDMLLAFRCCHRCVYIYLFNVHQIYLGEGYIRDQSRYASSQWETSLHCNDISHWLGAYLDCSLVILNYHVVGHIGLPSSPSNLTTARWVLIDYQVVCFGVYPCFVFISMMIFNFISGLILENLFLGWGHSLGQKL